MATSTRNAWSGSGQGIGPVYMDYVQFRGIQVDEFYYSDTSQISETEFGYIDGVTAGTRTASKAIVVDASGTIDALDITTLSIGTTAVTATAAEINYNAGVTPGTVTASKTVMVGTKKDIDFIQFGSAATSVAILHGGGIAGTPETTATANKNFLGYWVESTATTGDARGIYTRLYISGAGGSGEAARFYTTVNNVTAATGGTVNGAHISLNVTGASGAISGSANALRCTLDFAASPTTIGGTVACLRLDSNIATGPTIPTGTAFIAINDLSNQNLDYLLSAETVGTTLFATAGTGANSAGVSTGGVAAKVLKCRVGGVDYWLPLFSSNA